MMTYLISLGVCFLLLCPLVGIKNSFKFLIPLAILIGAFWFQITSKYQRYERDALIIEYFNKQKGDIK